MTISPNNRKTVEHPLLRWGRLGVSSAMALSIMVGAWPLQVRGAEQTSKEVKSEAAAKPDSDSAEAKPDSDKAVKAENASEKADTKPATAGSGTPEEKEDSKESEVKKAGTRPARGADDPRPATGLNGGLRTMINRGEWKEASDVLEKLVARNNYPSRDHAWLAFSYLFLGRSDELKSLSAKLGGVSPSSPYARMVKAFDMTGQGKFEESEKELLALPPSFGGDPLANFALSLVAAKQGKAAAAAAYCQKSVELDPDFAWGFRTLGYLEQRWLDNPAGAEEAYRKALAAEPKMVEAQEALIDLRLLKNDFDGAIEIAKSGIKKEKTAGGYYRLSQIYTEQWRLREALDLIARAIDLDPTNPRFYRSRAAIKSFKGELNDAIADQEKAVGLSKDKAFELIELSNMNVLAGNNNRAADNLKDALKIEPDNLTAHDKLARLLNQEKRFEDLVDECKRLVAEKPKEPKYRMELAQALVNAGRLDEAIDEYKESANLVQTDPEPHRRLGAIYVKKKDWSVAAREYTRALNINPSSVGDLVALAYCYAQDDEFLKAETAFVTALALYQLSPDAHKSGPSRLDIMRSLGALFLDEGRYADAARQFESVSVSSRGTSLYQVDKFMLAQARALRDLSGISAEALVAEFEKLPSEAKGERKIALVDALTRAGRGELAKPFTTKGEHDVTDKNAESQWLIVSARALLQSGDLAGAEKTALKATEFEGQTYPQKSEAFLCLSEVMLAAKQYEKANEAANKALEAYGKCYGAYVVIGRTALQKGDSELALSSAKKAIDLNPYCASAYILKGDALMSSGQTKEASNTFRAAVELYPNHLDAHKGSLSAFLKLGMKDEADREKKQIAQLETQR